MDQGGISLLPESRRRIEISIPGENRAIYFGIGVVLMVFLLFAGVKIYTAYLNNKLSEIENEINLIEGQRNKEFEREALVLNQQFALVGNLLNKHLIWSNVLARVQGRIPSQVQFQTLLGDASESKIEIKGWAVNYTTIAKQIAALLSDETVADISLDKVSTFPTGVLEYNIKILFDKDKFLLSKTDSK